MKVKLEDITKGVPIDYIYYDTEIDTNSMLLIKHPVPVVIVVLYLAILWGGTRWMKTKPPFQLKTILRIYNFCQVALNVYILSTVLRYPQCVDYVWRMTCKYSSEDVQMILGDTTVLNAYFFYSWCYLVLKMVDLLDTKTQVSVRNKISSWLGYNYSYRLLAAMFMLLTLIVYCLFLIVVQFMEIFMVFRKKNSHITFLHVYHHVSMVLFSWYTLKYAKAFQSVVPAFINVFVHTIMYTYYFLSTFGPSVQKYLWWKHHLTKIQMAQFVAVFTFISLLIYNDCSISRTFTFIWLINVFVFLCLFISFYINTYRTKPNTTSVSLKNK